MELYQLKNFQTIARFENVSRAAEELNVSQPALSMTISQIESELGVKLFDRKGRSIKLNDAGKVFLNGIDSMFMEFENAKSRVSDMCDVMNNSISLATTGSHFLVGVLKDYLEGHTNVMIHQSTDTTDSIFKRLSTGNVDFAITSPPMKGTVLETVILKKDDLVLIVPTSHRFAGRKSICLEEVAGDPFLTLEQNYNFRTVTDQICREAGFTPNIVFEVGDALMLEMLKLGRGIALLPRYVTPSYVEVLDSLIILEIEEPVYSMQIGLSWVKKKYLSKTAEDFKNYVVENYGQYFMSE